VVQLRPPPLRERGRDVLLLAEHFLRQFNAAMNKPVRHISPGAQQKLLTHHWPGNVRELRNVIERAVILETGTEIHAASLPEFHLETRLRKSELPVVPTGQSIDEVMSNFEREFILNSLEQHRYNLTRTAEQLKISRHALRYRMQRLNIHTEAEEDAGHSAAKEASSC
jgi:DNA-binding NtrC family response regulator